MPRYGKGRYFGKRGSGPSRDAESSRNTSHRARTAQERSMPTKGPWPSPADLTEGIPQIIQIAGKGMFEFVKFNGEVYHSQRYTPGSSAHSGDSDNWMIGDADSFIEVTDYGLGNINFVADAGSSATITSGGLKLSSGARIKEFSKDENMGADAPSHYQVPSQKSVNLFVSGKIFQFETRLALGGGTKGGTYKQFKRSKMYRNLNFIGQMPFRVMCDVGNSGDYKTKTTNSLTIGVDGGGSIERENAGCAGSFGWGMSDNGCTDIFGNFTTSSNTSYVGGNFQGSIKVMNPRMCGNGSIMAWLWRHGVDISLGGIGNSLTFKELVMRNAKYLCQNQGANGNWPQHDEAPGSPGDTGQWIATTEVIDNLSGVLKQLSPDDADMMMTPWEDYTEHGSYEVTYIDYEAAAHPVSQCLWKHLYDTIEMTAIGYEIVTDNTVYTFYRFNQTIATIGMLLATFHNLKLLTNPYPAGGHCQDGSGGDFGVPGLYNDADS